MDNGHELRSRRDDNGHGSNNRQLLSPPRRLSSPLLSSPTRSRPTKEKRNPSVTPRRFRKFFTPTAASMRGRRILSSLDETSTNRQPLSPSSLRSDILSSDPVCPSPSRLACENAQKRKFSHDEEGSSDPKDDAPLPSLRLACGNEGLGLLPAFRSSQGAEFRLQTTEQDRLGDWRKATLGQFFRASRGQTPLSKDDLSAEHMDPLKGRSVRTKIREPYQPNPIRKFVNRGFEAQLLDREHGFSSHTGRRTLAYPAYDERSDTANFCSTRADWYRNTSNEGHPIPFSLASSMSTSVTAVGDESGHVRFLDVDANMQGGEMLRSSMHVHTNGILDLAFSEDGSRLVTGSADRTCTVIDVETETIAVQLSNEHVGTIRQVAFQPGHSNGNIIASGGLDGRIVIWDLRCGSVPAQTFTTRDSKDGRIRTQRNTSMPVVNGSAINRIYKAHSRVYDGKESKASLTSIHWLPEGRQHLLLSSSDVNTSVKLWDTRWMKPSSNPEYKPVSKTTPPSHHTFRPYGLMSITMNADASRFYALCYDNTVYAYSTAHLVLGQAPELSDRCVKRRPRDGDGLGPLYGFKNEHLDVRSFYLRARVRPASNYGPELLAVGSRSAWPILFPTDERYLRTAWSKRNHILRQDPLLSGTPSSARPATTPQSLSPSNCDIPIYRCGTPLAHGHSREVTNVAWTHSGRLVTASDDGYIRHWQEDAAEARHLRQVGDFGGERWMAGWALVDDDWDGEDDCGDDDDNDDEQ